MQLIVGDKRVNVTMRAKGAMIVIIAVKGEELHKVGLPKSLSRRLLVGCSCSLLSYEHEHISVQFLAMVRADQYHSCV